MRALAQARRLGITFAEELVQGLLRGIIEPDEKPDFRYITVTRYRRRRVYTCTIERRIPHHDIVGTAIDDVTRGDFIRYYVYLASYLYRRGQYYDSGRALGRAIHYVQDSTIPYTENHEELENDIERCLKSKICNETAIKIVNEAYEKTLEIIKLFYEIISTEPSQEHINMLKSRIRKIRTLKIALCTVPPLVILFLSFMLNTLLIFLLYLLLVEPQIVSVVVHWTPKTYWEAFKMGLLRLKLRSYRTAM